MKPPSKGKHKTNHQIAAFQHKTLHKSRDFGFRMLIVCALAVVVISLAASLYLLSGKNGTLTQKTSTPENDAASAHYLLGTIYYGQGDMENALLEMNRTLELDPLYSDAHVYRGAIMAIQGDEDGSLAELEAAVRVGPESDRAHFALGYRQLLMGRLNESIAELRQAIRLNDSNAGAHISLGHALAQNGDLNEARMQWGIGLGQDPKVAGFQASMVKKYLDEGRPELAAVLMQELKGGQSSPPQMAPTKDAPGKATPTTQRNIRRIAVYPVQ